MVIFRLLWWIYFIFCDILYRYPNLFLLGYVLFSMYTKSPMLLTLYKVLFLSYKYFWKWNSSMGSCRKEIELSPVFTHFTRDDVERKFHNRLPVFPFKRKPILFGFDILVNSRNKFDYPVNLQLTINRENYQKFKD